MKRKIYITAFTFLGILVGIIAHVLVAAWYAELLFQNFERWSFGIPWSAWPAIHNISFAIVLFAGAFAGFMQGKHWWRQIYELGRRPWRKR